MSKKHIDPDAARYYQDFPEFPGVDKCIELLGRKTRHQPGYWSCMFHELAEYAKNHLDEVIAGFESIESNDIRFQFMITIAEAKIPEAELFLIANLRFEDKNIRQWAIIGLVNLDTRGARKALWQARSYQFATPQETNEFRRDIEHQMGWNQQS